MFGPEAAMKTSEGGGRRNGGGREGGREGPGIPGDSMINLQKKLQKLLSLPHHLSPSLLPPLFLRLAEVYFRVLPVVALCLRAAPRHYPNPQT